MMIKEFDVLELLPQRPPFIMIDRLCACDGTIAETKLRVSEGNLFCRDGVLREPGIVENMAQTCAARIGYLNKIGGAGVKVGFIGALRDLEIYELPKVAETLETHIEVLSEVMSLTLVKATVKCNGRLMAECEMKIAINEES